MKNYTDINSKAVDGWNEGGWEWSKPVTPEEIQKAKNGDFDILLTPTKFIPRDWLGSVKGKKLLGLASGGGQQMPLFAAAGAACTTFDYSQKQLESDIAVAKRENLTINTIRGDMTKPLPFDDNSFDVIVNPVSTCYIKDVTALWKECYRVLKKGGIFVTGLGSSFSYAFDDDGKLDRPLPFNPLADEKLFKTSVENDWGIQFSHTLDEQIGGQLKAGFTLVDIFEDYDGYGVLREYNLPTFFATKAVK